MCVLLQQLIVLESVHHHHSHLHRQCTSVSLHDQTLNFSINPYQTLMVALGLLSSFLIVYWFFSRAFSNAKFSLTLNLANFSEVAK